MKLSVKRRSSQNKKLTWSIQKKLIITVLSCVLVAFGFVVSFQFANQRAAMQDIAVESYSRISGLLSIQMSGAVRWKKTEVIHQTYQAITDSDGSNLANVRVVDVKGEVIDEFSSTQLKTFDLSQLTLQPESLAADQEPIISAFDNHLVISVPIVNAKDNVVIGQLSTAWSLEYQQQRLTSELIVQIVLALVFAIALAGLLIFGALISIVRPARSLAEDLGFIAEGDFTRPIRHKSGDELGLVADSARSILIKLGDSMKRLASGGMQISAYTWATYYVLKETGTLVDRQQQETEQVATATHQLGVSVQEVARNTSDTAEAAKQADEQTQNGLAVVNQTTQVISELSDGISEAAKQIVALEEASENIGNVMGVISGLAEQTNLLALNAAIEAARAGEQGRGFAVVADEVRSLAHRTQESANEIRTIIETVQERTNGAVALMEKSTTQAQNGVDQAELANQALNAIAAAVNHINDMSAQIASSTEEQASVTNDLAERIELIKQMAQQAKESGEQNMKFGDITSKLSSDFTQIVSEIKVLDDEEMQATMPKIVPD